MANILLDVKTVDGYKKRIAELEQELADCKKSQQGARDVWKSYWLEQAAEIPVGYVVPVKDRGDKQAFTAGVMATREAIRAKLDKL